MRQHQSWYRDQVLGTPYGAGPNENDTTLYGNMLTKEAAETGLNFLTPGIFEAVRCRLAESRDGETIERFRLMRNMLSSQPMCFNLFGELWNDLDLATVLCRALWGGQIARVTSVQFEWAPLPKEEYLNESKGTAFDVFFEYESPMGDKGFIGVETKLTEPFTQHEYDRAEYRQWMMKDSPWRTDVNIQELVSKKYNQIWRNHLLSWALLSHPESGYSMGNLTVIFHPLDKACAESTSAYRKLLSGNGMFTAFHLEEIVSVWKPLLARSAEVADFVKNKERLRAASQWLEDFEVRYLRLGASAQPARHGGERKVSSASMVEVEKRLRKITESATKIRKHLQLQAIQRRYPDVHFRPGAGGIAMVGLRPESPQRGRSGITDIEKFVENFDDEFQKYCVDNPPDRPTPEKVLQSHLIREAYSNGRRMAFSRNKMAPLNTTVENADTQVELIFVTDEIRLPVQGDDKEEKDKVCDILALRLSSAGHVPVVIELKTERNKAELIKQVKEFSRLIDTHADLFGELYGALLGDHIAFARPCERWVVWPAAKDNNNGPDIHEDDFAAQGIQLVTYIQDPSRSNGYQFRVGCARA